MPDTPERGPSLWGKCGRIREVLFPETTVSSFPRHPFFIVRPLARLSSLFLSPLQTFPSILLDTVRS